MGELNRVYHGLFFHLLAAGLDHHDAVLGAHDHDVEQAVTHLRVGRINDELSVNKTDAHRAHRTLKRNVGESQGAGSSVDGYDVRVVLGIGRKHECNDLGLAAETFREKRADRAVDLAAGENLALTGAAFALNESAGDAAAGIGVFTVVDRQREEIDSFPRFGVGHSGGQDNVVAQAYHSTAMRLLRQFSCFQSDAFSAGKFNASNLRFGLHDSFLF